MPALRDAVVPALPHVVRPARQGEDTAVMTVLQYAPPGPYQPAPSPVLHGELTADGTRILLVATGDPWGIDQIAALIHTPTPLVERARLDGRDTEAMWCPATWAAVVQLGFTYNGTPGLAWQPGPRLQEWMAAEAARRLSPVPPLPEDILPPGAELVPRPYQLDGGAQIAAEGKFLLLDEQGAGKTATTLLGLEGRRRAGHAIFPLLVVVPSWEVGQAWADEITRCALDWGEPAMYQGTGRLRLLRHAGVRILITTYATLRRDADSVKAPLVRRAFAAVVADEIHLASNGQALQTKALHRVARDASAVVGLSGTAVTRDTGDIHPILEAMDPRSWPDRKRMTARYCIRVQVSDYEERIMGLNPLAAPEFFAIMDRQMRRVTKAQVLPQLPKKIWSVRKPEIPPEWVHAYRTLEADMLAELPDGGELPVMTTLLKFMRLSQLASSAADVDKTMEWDDRLGDYAPKYHVTLRAPSWKAESLLGIMAERPGQPVVCFTASRQLAMIAGKYCEDAGYRTGYVTGIGGGITGRTRQDAIRGFQAGELDVLVATAKAGGTGITLTRAGTAVFLQRDLALAEGVQPEDRLHRIGQENACVEIIDVVARGTVEDRIRKRLREKAGMLGEIVRDSKLARELLGGIR